MMPTLFDPIVISPEVTKLDDGNVITVEGFTPSLVYVACTANSWFGCIAPEKLAVRVGVKTSNTLTNCPLVEDNTAVILTMFVGSDGVNPNSVLESSNHIPPAFLK
jgi:hypothetical protein